MVLILRLRNMIDDFALIDWFSVTLIITFGLIGLFNGFVKEVFSAAAWILSLLIAWVYGPFLFPFVQDYVNSDSLKNIISFILMFLISFLTMRIVGSVISRFISAIGLKGLDRLLGLFFGSVKVLAILSSIFVFNLTSLDKNQWWLDSYSRIYSLQVYEYSKPIFDKWIKKADIILDKDNPKITL